MKKNFLIKQYLSDKKMKIRHNYLSEQFKNSKKIFKLINDTVKFNDFTLGRYVDLFEKEFCICHSCLFEEVASVAGKDKKVRVKVLDGDRTYYLTFDGKKYNWDIPPDEPEQN